MKKQMICYFMYCQKEQHQGDYFGHLIHSGEAQNWLLIMPILPFRPTGKSIFSINTLIIDWLSGSIFCQNNLSSLQRNK